MKSGSNLERVLQSDNFAVTIEVSATKSPNPLDFIKKVNILKGYGDAYNVTDNQMAKVRLSSLASAALCIRVGLEPIMQMVCRDRNRIALQSDVLGASAVGIRNVLCMRGDPSKLGDQKDAKEVFDLDPVQLIGMIKDMRDSKVLLSGANIPEGPKVLIGAVTNPLAQDYEVEIERLEEKVEAGADFIQTQAIFDVAGLDGWMDQVRARGIHERCNILCGIIPLSSYGQATFLKDRIPGITIPQNILDRILNSKDPKETGIEISLELVAHLRKLDSVRGVHIMPVGWVDAAPRIVQAAGLFPRPTF